MAKKDAKTRQAKETARSKAKKEVAEDTSEAPSSSIQSKPIGTIPTSSGSLQEVEPICFNCHYFQPGLGGPICANPEAEEYRHRVGDNHRGEDFTPRSSMRTPEARGVMMRSRVAKTDEEGLYTPEPLHPEEAKDDLADV